MIYLANFGRCLEHYWVWHCDGVMGGKCIGNDMI